MKKENQAAQYLSPAVESLMLSSVAICDASANDSTITDVDFVDYGEI